jgi:hypothetical protein
MSSDLQAFQNAPGFTVFHTHKWIEMLLAAFPRWRDASRIIDLADGRRVWLPMLQTDHVGLWRWLDALPFGFFGNPVVNTGSLSRSDVAQILQTAQPGVGWLAINLDPYDPLAQPDLIPAGVVSLTTHLLDLSAGFEPLVQGFSKMVLRHLRHAEREGVSARRGQGSTDFLTYYRLTQRAIQRWQLTETPFPRALYEALAGLPPQWVSLWLAERDGQALGGLISLHYAPGRIMYWGSALDPEYAYLNPTKLLQREAIREACQRGAQIYNMGPSVGFDGKPLEGVRQAKEALGARPHDYAIIILMNAWAMRARALRNRLLGRA